MKKGYLALVLQSHTPYVRHIDRRLYGEEMLDRAIAETYLPLLNVLYDLRAEGVPYRLTVGFTPILVEQLADDDVLDHFETYLLELLARIGEDEQRFAIAERRGQDPRAGHFLYLARFYRDWYDNLLHSFRDRFERDLVAAFRRLQDQGFIEITTSAATHAYLPLLNRGSSLYGQLRTGVTSYLRHFGTFPRGLWLPECGYRPAERGSGAGDGASRPGLEVFVATLNLRYTFVDAPAIEGAPLPADRAGEVPIPSPLPWEQQVVPKGEYRSATSRRTTLLPYLIRGSQVAVYGRDAVTGRQVWSTSAGYPGDYLYREVRRHDERSGLCYWRITGEEVPLPEKELYDPYHAFHRVQQHAVHFAEVVRERLSGHRAEHDAPGVVVAAYETEFFGRWWFEGIAWLKEILPRLAQDPELALVTAGDYLERHPPQQEIDLPPSSWGRGGGHEAWLNGDTEWMWPLIRRAERSMEDLVERFPDARGERLEVLKQAARELLLLQSSDWPYYLSSQQAPDYARQRFRDHVDRFNRLCTLSEQQSLDEHERTFLQRCQHLDNPFLNIDYRVFARREGQAV